MVEIAQLHELAKTIEDIDIIWRSSTAQHHVLIGSLVKFFAVFADILFAEQLRYLGRCTDYLFA